MRDWIKYALIVVGTFAFTFALHWVLKHNKEDLNELILNGLALSLPISISNCLIYRINKNKNKK